jgi:hypothetical protein
MLKGVLSEHGIKDDLAIDVEQKPYLKDIKAEFDKDPVADVKEAIANALKEPIPEKPESEYLYEKPNVNMTDLSSEVRIDAKNKDPLEMQDFLKVGYRPDLKNIEQEYNTATPLYDAVVKNGVKLSDDQGVQSAAADILMKNYARLKLFKAKVEKENGVTEAAEKLLSTMDPIYAVEDQGFVNNNPTYVPPQIPADLGKEKVEISFDENKEVQVSEKIDEVVRNAPEKDLV